MFHKVIITRYINTFQITFKIIKKYNISSLNKNKYNEQYKIIDFKYLQ